MSEDRYQRELGERLRAIRAQQGMTLQDVEARSDGRWKAVVIGSYERGDRAVSIAKLAELARFYGVPLGDLLPRPRREDGEPTAPADERNLILDLTRLEGDDVDPHLETVRRYAERIKVQRGDYNGRVLSLRSDDLRALAVVFDSDVDDLVDHLTERDVVRTASEGRTRS